MSEKKYLVREYMSDRNIPVNPDMPMKEAIKLMQEEDTHGLIVTDENGKVVGILSSLDIIRYIVPDYLEQDKSLALFEAASVFARRIKEMANHPVKKFMTKNVHAVKPDDTLIEAAVLVCEHGIRQLPVVEKDGTLIGYINRTDIKRAIADVLGVNGN